MNAFFCNSSQAVGACSTRRGPRIHTSRLGSHPPSLRLRYLRYPHISFDGSRLLSPLWGGPSERAAFGRGGGGATHSKGGVRGSTVIRPSASRSSALPSVLEKKMQMQSICSGPPSPQGGRNTETGASKTRECRSAACVGGTGVGCGSACTTALEPSRRRPPVLRFALARPSPSLRLGPPLRKRKGLRGDDPDM